MVIYTCKAITLEENKKIKCTVNIATNQIQLIGKFANHAKGRVIKFDDFRLLSTNLGEEKLGLFKKDYIEIVYNGKCLRKLYFKNIDSAHSFENAIKNQQKEIQKRDEERRIAEEKRKNEVYSDACALMSKITIENLKQAITKFQSISNWKDSAAKINICNNKIKELEKKQEEERKDKIYNEAVSAIKQDNPTSYKIALDKFKSILNWRDSKQLSSRCEGKLDEAYNAALTLMFTNTIEDFEMAIKKFQEIIGWKDSTVKVDVCKDKIIKIKQKLEEERKEKIYQEAIALIKLDSIDDYENAIKKLSEINDWKDSKVLIDNSKNRIKEIKRKIEEERKNKIYAEATDLMNDDTIESYEQALGKFDSISGWLDSKSKIDICNKKIQRIKDAAFWDSIKRETDKYKNAPENTEAHSGTFKKYPKAIFEMFVQNPYFVLGLPCTASQAELLNVKDKIEKFARLKLANSYKSTYDLKNIEKPSRDISNVQSSIVSAKELKYKWLWFSNDEYCGCWESDRLFEALEKDGKDNIDYNLLVACYLHLVIMDTEIEKTKQWNTIISYIDHLLNLPSIELVEILRKHINSNANTETIGDLTSSFVKSIVLPLIKICENANSKQIQNLSKIKGFTNKKANEELCSAIIMNLINRCYPLENYLKDFPESPTKTDTDKLKELSKNTVGDIHSNIDAMIKIVDEESTYAKRIKKKYRDVFWKVTVELHDQNLDDTAIPYAKNIYPYCDEDDKRILRNTYGFEVFGVSESELSPSEMNSMAIKFEEEGNISQSIYWFKKAAEAGDEYAQSNLAFRYFEGKGVPQSKSTAKMWWTRSANQGNETARNALRTMFQIPHEHYDLGYVYIGWGETKIVEVSLNYTAYVRLLSDYDFRNYISGETYNYYGGLQTQTPCRIKIPSNGNWHVVVDNDGDDLGGISSSCSTRTISNY